MVLFLRTLCNINIKHRKIRYRLNIATKFRYMKITKYFDQIFLRGLAYRWNSVNSEKKRCDSVLFDCKAERLCEYASVVLTQSCPPSKVTSLSLSLLSELQKRPKSFSIRYRNEPTFFCLQRIGHIRHT